MRYRNTAVNTVHTQLVAHKIDAGMASLLLDQFRVPPDQRDALIRLWSLEALARVQTLTAAQVKSALRKGILDPEAAVARLVGMGYTEEDAQIVLTI